MKNRKVLSAVLAALALWFPANVVAQTQVDSEPVYRDAGFTRGDANGDGRVDISDPLSTFSDLFLGTSIIRCNAAADADANALLDLSDGVLLLNFLALGGQAPAAPFPECAGGSTGGLSCAEQPCAVPAAPVGSFTFYGKTYEADSVVFAIGRSTMMGLRNRRMQIAEEIKVEIAGLPPTLPFDIVYYDGEKTATLSTSGTPSVLLSTAQDATNSTIDQLFTKIAPGDDLEALFTTAITCASRGTGKQAVIYLGDGWDTSFGESAATSMPANRQAEVRVRRAIHAASTSTSTSTRNEIPIHTIGLHRYTESVRAFMRKLAGENNGTHTSMGDIATPPVLRDSC
jgi:hypothetical protein